MPGRVQWADQRWIERRISTEVDADRYRIRGSGWRGRLRLTGDRGRQRRWRRGGNRRGWRITAYLHDDHGETQKRDGMRAKIARGHCDASEDKSSTISYWLRFSMNSY